MSIFNTNEKAWHLDFGEVLVTGILNNGTYRCVTPEGGVHTFFSNEVIPWDRRPGAGMRRLGAPPDEKQLAIMLDVWDERDRQDKLFGPQNEASTMDRMFVVLGEEFGEACQAHLSGGNTGKATDKRDLRTELIQTAAVVVAMIERIDAGRLD